MFYYIYENMRCIFIMELFSIRRIAELFSIRRTAELFSLHQSFLIFDYTMRIPKEHHIKKMVLIVYNLQYIFNTYNNWNKLYLLSWSGGRESK